MGYAMVQAQLPALAVDLRVIPDREARWFVRTHHYLHRALHMGQLSYGLYRQGRLDGVFTFGYPFLTVPMFGFHPLDYLEFARCVWLDKSDRNLGSRTIATILRRVAGDWQAKYPARTRPLVVVSYADLSRHTGTLYRACNFLDTGTIRGHHGYGPRDYRIKHEDGLTMKRRFIYPLDVRARRRLLRHLTERAEVA